MPITGNRSGSVQGGDDYASQLLWGVGHMTNHIIANDHGAAEAGLIPPELRGYNNAAHGAAVDGIVLDQPIGRLQQHSPRAMIHDRVVSQDITRACSRWIFRQVVECRPHRVVQSYREIGTFSIVCPQLSGRFSCVPIIRQWRNAANNRFISGSSLHVVNPDGVAGPE